jgi:hypothetical protein
MGSRRHDNVFVVRTWLESEHDAGTMRGRIDHVGSGRCRYFANYGDLCDFISFAQSAAPQCAEPAGKPETASQPLGGRSGDDPPLR